MSKKVIVFGATGNLGAPISVYLKQNRYDVIVVIEVFSPKDNPSPVIYVKDKPDPLENAFEITKIKRDFGYEPLYTYILQLEDLKHDMETEPFAKLWGTKEDYEPKESKQCYH